MPAHRKLETFAQKPEQHLPGRTELTKLVEYQRQGFNNATIRVLHDLPITALEIPDRDRRDELPAASLLVSCLERSQPQNVEFILVETALEPEEQSVVPSPRIIDRLVIHEHGIYHSTHLNKLLPVATVPRESRHLPGRHNPYLAETDIRNHPLEPTATRRSSG